MNMRKKKQSNINKLIIIMINKMKTSKKKMKIELVTDILNMLKTKLLICKFNIIIYKLSKKILVRLLIFLSIIQFSDY